MAYCRGVASAAVVLVAVASLCSARSSDAYEFEVRARAIGQGSELRSIRLLGPDALLTRRRFTQTLELDIWDLAGRLARGTLREVPPPRAPHYFLSTYMRIDHDFGAWTTGELVVGSRLVDVLDRIPELDSTALELQVLYGYVAAEGLAGGAIDVYVGRQLGIDTLDWWSMDGVKVRVHAAAHVAVEAFAGLRVRDASIAASATFEPDGTGSAECAEYVEGQIPGTGSWRPIDLSLATTGSDFENDFERCPQRDEWMPTFGAAIETHQTGPVWARLAYRRSMSPTVGVIGGPFRLETRDVGLYPNEDDQAPDWGVNEERLVASARVQWRRDGLQLMPSAAVRYSLLHGVIDEAHAGASLRYGRHRLEPELYYHFPTFDGDSIFNVFSANAYRDARLTYDVSLSERWSSYVRGWLRRYDSEAPSELAAVAGGAMAGARYRSSQALLARLDLFYDDGYGGQRLGGFATGRWRLSERTNVSGRLSVVRSSDPLQQGPDFTSLGAQAGASYRLNRGVLLHLVGEENHNRFYDSQLRLLGVLDLAFTPEM